MFKIGDRVFAFEDYKSGRKTIGIINKASDDPYPLYTVNKTAFYNSIEDDTEEDDHLIPIEKVTLLDILYGGDYTWIN